MDKKYFSAGEFAVLQCYANDETICNLALANKLNIAKTTADPYNKRILQIARNTFSHPFHDSK